MSLREVQKWPKVRYHVEGQGSAPREPTPSQATPGSALGGQREGSQAEACSPSPHPRQGAKGDRKWRLAISGGLGGGRGRDSPVERASRVRAGPHKASLSSFWAQARPIPGEASALAGQAASCQHRWSRLLARGRASRGQRKQAGGARPWMSLARFGDR